MQQPHDTLDIALLRSNRDAFILKCQPIIEIVIRYFIKSGLFRSDQLRDIVQSVNEEFIIRLPGIERNYNGSTLMATYVNAVIRNICLDLNKTMKETIPHQSMGDVDHGTDGEPIIDSLIVQDELKRFDAVLTMFLRQRMKLQLCLKMFYRIPVDAADVTGCFDGMTVEDAESLLRNIGRHYAEAPESDLFSMIAPLMNQKEGNSTSGPSLRRWTQEQITRIIEILNSGPSQRAHTTETIKILMDHYSQRRQRL